MSPPELATIVGSVCPKFDMNLITATETINVRVAKGYKAKVITKLEDTLPEDFQWTVTDNFKAGNPVGAFYVDGVMQSQKMASNNNTGDGETV